jgi:hypothetical protein
MLIFGGTPKQWVPRVHVDGIGVFGRAAQGHLRIF